MGSRPLQQLHCLVLRPLRVLLLSPLMMWRQWQLQRQQLHKGQSGQRPLCVPGQG